MDRLTKQKRSSCPLPEAEEKYRFLVENANEAIFVTQDDLVCLLNPKAVEILGYSKAEINSRPFINFIHPDDRQMVMERHLKRMKGEKLPEVYPFRILAGGGDCKWVEVDVVVITWEGRPALLVFLKDIGERKRAEDFLRAQHELALALNASSSLDEGLHLCLEAALQASTMDCGGIYLLDESGGVLDLAVHTGLGAEFIKSASHYDANSPNTKLVKAGWPIYSRHPGMGLPLPEQKRQEHLLAIAIVPMCFEGQIIGCLNVASHILEEVPFFARSALETIAAQIGSAVARLKMEQALHASESRFRSLVESVTDYIYTVKIEDGRPLSTRHGPGCQTVTGYTAEEYAADAQLWYRMVYEEDKEKVREQSARVLAGEVVAPLEHRLVHKDGSISWVRSTLVPRYNEKGMLVAYDGLIADVSERKRAEAALQESERKYRAIFENSIEGIGISKGNQVIDANQALLDIWGYGLDEFRKISLLELIAQSSRPLIEDKLQKHESKERFEFWIHRKDGQERLLDISTSHLRIGNEEHTISTFWDITEKKAAEETLKASLKEKEALLRELYHRTKNNMQVICALLEMQSAEAKEEHITGAFRDISGRIRSMALVHQMLYQSHSLTSINFREYIVELAKLLLSSYHVQPSRVSLQFAMEDVFLTIDAAIPCGLILNELLANAFRHAFPGDRQGEIRIGLHRSADGEIEFQVSDNGVGVPVGFDCQRNARMGLRTVLTLGEQQLQGEVQFRSQNGTTCLLRFKDKKE